MTEPDNREVQRSFATAIQAERAARGLTVKALAELADITEQTLARVLKCQRDMTVGQLHRIAGVFGMTVAELASEAARRSRQRPSLPNPRD